jgi:signal transduction histidine kinase
MSSVLTMQDQPRHKARGLFRSTRYGIRARMAGLMCATLLLAGGVLLAVTLGVWQSRTGAVTAAPSPSGSANSAITTASQYGADRHQLVVASLIALAIVAVIALILGWLMAGRFLRPLRAMTAAAREISAANLHQRLNLHRPEDELKELGDTLDELLDRLERSFTFERQFIANASHELRTPIAAMQASLEVAMAKPEPVPSHITTLADRMGRELEQATRLLDGLLALAHSQHEQASDETILTLDELARDALERHAKEVSAMELRVECSPDAGGSVAGNPTLLARMVENVIANAVVHNQPGGWIRVSTVVADDSVRLTVQNGGESIDSDHVTSLTKPFQRLRPARTGSHLGAGLGLAIAASIAESHGGRVELRALTTGGLAATIALPLTVPTAARAAA